MPTTLDIPKVDLATIFDIESSGNPKAYNPKSKATGLGQITPIVLKDYNNLNPDAKIAPVELFDPSINTNIASWYMNVRIPQLLTHFKLADTVENRLAAYNAGVGSLLSGKPLPAETQNYIKKYKERQIISQNKRAQALKKEK